MFRSLFNNNLDAVFLTIPDGRILAANSAACSIFGMSEEEIISLGRKGLLDPHESKHHAALEEREKEGRFAGVKLYHIRKNGQRFPAEVDSFILPDDPQRSFVIPRDISERTHAEEMLRARELELGEAQRLAHIGSWHWVAQTDSITGTDELLKIYGFDPLTQTIPNFKDQRGLWYSPEEWNRLDAAAQESARTGKGAVLEEQALHNGQRIWIQARSEVVYDTEGKFIGMRGTVQDITERKRIEEELRQRAEELERLLETVPVAVWVAHDPHSLTITGNRMANEFYGIKAGEKVSATTQPESSRFFAPDG
ncbi:MAG: PAS domain S-box protein [Desulfobulbaceae bacterium]|uniref:histidine kinase n=2 Tax=Desulfofustis glycolicus TaxID=51195 RepID=A0A1M5YEL7_9BACT|nr:PAS domain S-box protein [Desulfobulbaceae bacterium]SHI10500.1 PAS domain S-box-containing protein [Desulfofustis glycolicus DSM 9705]